MAISIPEPAPASLVQPHARRGLRSFFLLIALLAILIALTGFWPSYFGRIAGAGVQRHWIIHLHAVVFSGWLVLLTTQALLVVRRRTALHRRLGSFGVAYGVLVLLTGLVATIAARVLHVSAGEWTLDSAAASMIYPLGDMVLFTIFFATAVVNRSRPEVHKRLIILATVALLVAPVARMPIVSDLAFLAVWLLPLMLCMAHDLWARRRIHPTYLIGLAILLVAFTRTYLRHSPEWLAAGRAILRAFLPAASGAG